ncbi:MAG: electron transport complex subunit E [Deltaproteobacteria bacterium]|nr:electron transport complex subunit E [Deltaproteobacteria bacterium]
MSQLQNFTKGLWRENPVLRILLGFCPTLAVTTSAIDALGMGAATTFVLLGSNTVISSIRKVVPGQMRIPVFIVVIATFVTVVDLVLQGYFPALSKSLGVFIPLIVVNCIILGRAEAFASKNGIGSSIIDGLGMGLGFTLALFVLGSVREVLGSGSIFGMPLFAADVPRVLIFILPPGAFMSLGCMLWLMNELDLRRKRRV